MNDATYKLDELARASGVSARTVRYYVQRGLLPAPDFRGKDSAYRHEHLVRLRAIRRLQDAFFPLDAIAVELERRSVPEIARIADGREIPAARTHVEESAPRRASAARKVEAPLSTPERTFRRITLAPGVELEIAADAPASSQRLANEILKRLEESDGGGA